MHFYPVIFTGGAGSRLWPVSREFYPKPLLPLFGDKTLLQDTAARLDSIGAIGNPVFVCNEEHCFLVAEQVRLLGKNVFMFSENESTYIPIRCKSPPGKSRHHPA